MDSDDNLDYYDSDYENQYSDDSDDTANLYDDEEDDSAVNPDDNSKSVKTFTVLQEDDINKRQEDQISHASLILSIPEVSASKLLYYYKWNVSQLHDEWFADEEKVRTAVGLPSDAVSISGTDELITCGICFDPFPIEEFHQMVCGHWYCKLCWKVYITTSITDGPGCLLLRCPEPSCKVAVCRDMVEELVAEEEWGKYRRYYLRSYVEESKKIKWCPMPGCENAIELELGNDLFDVACLCSGMGDSKSITTRSVLKL